MHCDYKIKLQIFLLNCNLDLSRICHKKSRKNSKKNSLACWLDVLINSTTLLVCVVHSSPPPPLTICLTARSGSLPDVRRALGKA